MSKRLVIEVRVCDNDDVEGGGLIREQAVYIYDGSYSWEVEQLFDKLRVKYSENWNKP